MASAYAGWYIALSRRKKESDSPWSRQWFYLLAVRKMGSQPMNKGSIPFGTTNAVRSVREAMNSCSR